MSFYILRDEYSISVEKTAKWNLFEGVSKEFTFNYSVFLRVLKEYTASWYVLAYVTNEFTFLWDVYSYIGREMTFLYRIAMDYSAKAKYRFSKEGSITRFFRSGRNG